MTETQKGIGLGMWQVRFICRRYAFWWGSCGMGPFGPRCPFHSRFLVGQYH